MNALIAAALLLWGWFAPLPITTHDAREDPAYDQVTSTAWADEDVSTPCEIWFGARFYAIPDETHQIAIVAHEIGHCLGLPHATYPGIMRDASFWTTPSAEDLNALRQRYPLPVRARAASIAAD